MISSWFLIIIKKNKKRKTEISRKCLEEYKNFQKLFCSYFCQCDFFNIFYKIKMIINALKNF